MPVADVDERTFLSGVMRDSLRSVSLGTAAVLLVFAQLAVFITGGTAGRILWPTETLAALVLLGVGLTARRFPIENVPALANGTLVFLHAIGALHIIVTRDPAAGTYFVFMGLLGSFLLLQASGYIVLAALTLSGGLLFAWAGVPALSGTSGIFLVVACLGLGAIILAGRRSAYRRMFRVQAEQARAVLAASQAAERARFIAEHALELIMLYSPTRGIIYVSPASHLVLGRSPEEVLAQPPDAHMHPDDLMESTAWGGRIVETGIPGQMEMRALRRDGSIAWLEVHGARIIDPETEEAMLITVSRDVTRRRLEEETLRRATRDAALATLVAGVAHEINNPLQFIEGNVSLAHDTLVETRADVRLPEHLRASLCEVEQHHAAIARGVDRIAHITRALRRVSRPAQTAREDIDVNTIVSDVVETARSRLGADVTVEMDLQAKGHPRASPEEIGQVILNLALNASDAMGGRGALRLATLDDEGGVLVQVVDSGPGVPADAREKLFVPFYTTKPEGTGLGLSISRRIAEDHGGSLTFQSEPGRTEFTLRLPVVQGTIDP